MIIATHAIDVNITLRHSCIVSQHFECGRFASPIDAQQAEAFTFFDSKINSIDGHKIIIALAQIRYDDCIFIDFFVADQCLG